MKRRAKRRYRYVVVPLILAVLFIAVVLNFTAIEKAIFYPRVFREQVERYSREYNVDKHLVYAVVKAESSFDPNAVSDVGARGLMQLMPDAVDWVSFRRGDEIPVDYNDIHDPDVNISTGTYLLKLLCDEYEDIPTAVAAYHAGRGTVNAWLENKEYSADGLHLVNIPSSVTREYVERVMKNYEKYCELYE